MSFHLVGDNTGYVLLTDADGLVGRNLIANQNARLKILKTEYEENNKELLQQIQELATQYISAHWPGETYTDWSALGYLRTLDGRGRLKWHGISTDVMINGVKLFDLYAEFVKEHPDPQMRVLKIANAPSWAFASIDTSKEFRRKYAAFELFKETDFLSVLPTAEKSNDRAFKIFRKLLQIGHHKLQSGPVEWALAHRYDNVSLFQKHVEVLENIEGRWTIYCVDPCSCCFTRFLNAHNAPGHDVPSGVRYNSSPGSLCWNEGRIWGGCGNVGYQMLFFCPIATLVYYLAKPFDLCLTPPEQDGFYHSTEAKDYAFAISVLHLMNKDEFKLALTDYFEEAGIARQGRGISPTVRGPYLLTEGPDWMYTKLTRAIVDFKNEPVKQKEFIEEVFANPNVIFSEAAQKEIWKLTSVKEETKL